MEPNALKDRLAAAILEHTDDDQRITRMRELRQLTRSIPIPDDKRFTDVESHSPDLADEGWRIAQSLMINGFKVQVTPTKFGVQKWEKNADDQGRWAEALLHAIGKKHAGEETAFAVTDACVNDGGGWSKLIYSPQDWEVRDNLKRADYTSSHDYLDAVEDAAKSDIPMRWIPVDALTVYPRYRGGKLIEIFETTQRPYSDAVDEFGVEFDGRKIAIGEPLSVSDGARSIVTSPPPKHLKVTEHWTLTTYDVLIEGPQNAVLTPTTPHGLPQVPYFYTPGLMPNWWRGRKAALSAGELKSWLIEYKDFLRTLQANAVARDTFTTFHRTRPQDGSLLMGEDGKPVTETDYDAGVIIEGGLGENIVKLDHMDVSTSLQRELQAVNLDIEHLMTPRVRSDIGGSGMEGAGFAISQVIAEAKVSHSAFSRHIQTTLEEVLGLVRWMVSNLIQDTVYVESVGGDGWIGIGPKDLTNHVGIHVALDPEQPSTRLIEQRYWNERISGGTAYPEQAIRALGDDPSEVEFMLVRGKMMQSPWFTMLMEQQVAQALGAGDLLAKAYQAQQIAQTGGGGGSGLPPAMGSQIVPDMGDQALRTTIGSNPGAGPQNAPNAGGVGPGAVAPTAGAVAGASF